MAMQVGTEGGDEDEVVSAINTTPLVDVMLVLLIIFLITIPVVTHTVPVKLPLAWKNLPVSAARSEEHTSELQSLMRISYAVFCLKKQRKRKDIATIRMKHAEKIKRNNSQTCSQI